MKFYVFTYKCVNKHNFNHLVHILPGIFAWDIDTKRGCDEREHSKTYIIVLIITVIEILGSVKHLPTWSAPHTECVIKINNLRWAVEPKNIISVACWIYW